MQQQLRIMSPRQLMTVPNVQVSSSVRHGSLQKSRHGDNTCMNACVDVPCTYVCTCVCVYVCLCMCVYILMYVL